MNTKTKEAIQRHGEDLLLAFPNATEKNPIALCKKLRRIETFIAPHLLRNCNEGIADTELDGLCQTAIRRTCELLNIAPSYALHIGLFINRDPRGCALKLSSEWTKKYNDALYKSNNGRMAIYTDWGGYGLLAPDLTQK